tara:strand:+ start:391 stop:906 length:516 start_codon:yes stop_codon:yes gene_type:complete
MEFKNIKIEKIAYLILITTLFILFISLALSRNSIDKNRLNFRKITNLNSNIEGFNNKEKKNIKQENANTSLSSSDIDTDTLLLKVDKHLKSLVSDLGNPKEVKQTREILKKTKKITDIESSKCIIKLLDENGDKKDFNIEDILSNEYDPTCQKYKKHTALSQSLQSIINSI